MARVTLRQGHPLERHGEIRAQLSSLIRSGAKPPGSRLPTRLELATQFQTTPVTIQKALNRLMADGFVKARGRSGTFVVDRPPHLYRFGIVITASRATGFLGAIVEQAARLAQLHHWDFPVYSSVDGSGNAEDYRRMLVDLQSHRLAGLIFTQPPEWFLHQPLFADPALPRVALVDHSLPGVGSVRLDNPQWMAKALDYLQAQGRQRVGVVATPNQSSAFVELVTRGAAARQLTMPPAWIQALDYRNPYWAAHVVAGLLNGPAAVRPDALIIADDHLVESVTTALLKHGGAGAADLPIVAHCNYPKLPAAALPVTWLGYDVRQVLQLAVEYIQQSLEGLSPAPIRMVPAQFSAELNESGRRRPDSGPATEGRSSQ